MGGEGANFTAERRNRATGSGHEGRYARVCTLPVFDFSLRRGAESSELRQRNLRMRMRRLLGTVSCIFLPLAPVSAFAETAYVEGHVFDKRTGQPLGFAEVTVEEVVSAGPVPRLRVSTMTDPNGFYQFEIDLGIPWRVGIFVFCETKEGLVMGTGRARLHEGTIRRDIYLDNDGKRIRGCR